MPTDVCLLLRAHAEQHWLSREVIPVLRQVETPSALPEEQVGAAFAYLEVIWIEAQKLAQETESAHSDLGELPANSAPLTQKASRYYSSVKHLRGVVARRVSRILRNPSEAQVLRTTLQF
ncbi:MAG TPA: hypothetical protein VID48_07085 [Solirubrobacteraceae bacterium]